MSSSTPSAVSRYRPAILILAGAAAAYSAYLLFSVAQTSPPSPLHRSNAVRRPGPRSHHARVARTVQHLQQHAEIVGEFDFFGHAIPLDPRNLITSDELRHIARETEPDASRELVEATIGQLYDTFLDRLLSLTFPAAPVSDLERAALTQLLNTQLQNLATLRQAIERHTGRFAGADDARTAYGDSDGAESIARTELSLLSDDDTDDLATDPDGQTLQRTLYHIAEDRARQEGVIHRGITCNGCDTKPIRGIRWRCANCADYDLCSDCEATNTHIKTHIFYKIRVPAPYLGLPKQEPVYPGRPHVMSPSINPTIKKRLVSETKMETEEIEALWEQFTVLAGTEWNTDPNHIGWALDRRSFNHAFIPRYSSFISAPNLIYDRIFSYYDTDHNTLIGFEEFVKGLDGMHSRDPKVKLRIVFNGYDVDGDGHISRKDVLRIFRAYYAIEKEATRNYLAEAADELSVRGALETIRSSQPLGSAFTQNSIPARNPLNPRLQEKNTEGSEDSQPVLAEDVGDSADREEIIEMTDPRNSIVNGHHYSDPENEGTALHNRWARRQFYVDEEEGLARPEGYEESAPASEAGEQMDGVTDAPLDRPRGSRSSSRVRFQDDIDFETRSNASTSSRPVGERWGGYEIPEPEKDLGKEVLYQITQQAFNELLNPLFQEKEDNAMDAFATRADRRKLSVQVEKAVQEFKDERLANQVVVFLGAFKYARVMLDIFTSNAEKIQDFLRELREQGAQLNISTFRSRIWALLEGTEKEVVHHYKNRWAEGWEPDAMDLWNAKLTRLQLKHELWDAVHGLATQFGWLPKESCSLKAQSPIQLPGVEHEDDHRAGQEALQVDAPYRDPTMPQFRPNSLADSHDVHTDGEHRDVEDDSESSATERDSSDDYVLGHTHYIVSTQGPFFILPDLGIHHGSPPSPLSPPLPSTDAAVPSERVPSPPPPPPPLPLPPPSNALHVPEPPPPPPPTHTETSPQPSPPQPEPPRLQNDPQIFFLRINTVTLTIHVVQRPVAHSQAWEHENSQKALERKVRRAAMEPDSPLHMHMLASLDAVDTEINDRKGSGLLSFAEFEEKMQDGRLRFLEAWMDWVSF